MLPDAIQLSCTLKELRGRIQEHLGFRPDDGACPEVECNCKLAHKVCENTTINECGVGDYDAAKTVIVVNGNNDVVAKTVSVATPSAVQEVAGHYLKQPGKTLVTIGGLGAEMGVFNDKRYIRMPVLAVCSSSRHTASQGVLNSSEAGGGRSDLILDLHTSEYPIEMTAHNATICLATAGLEDRAADGVLKIYAVQRWTDDQDEVRQGKAGIFKKCHAWEHLYGQLDRGLSNLLSTLRMFAHLTTGGEMEEAR